MSEGNFVSIGGKGRYCSSCGEAIFSPDKTYCPFCGENLPSLGEGGERGKEIFVPQGRSRQIKGLLLNIFALVSFLIFLAAAVLFLQQLLSLGSSQEPPFGSEELGISLNLEEDSFFEEALYNLVPKDSDFYIEGKDALSFFESLYPQETSLFYTSFDLSPSKVAPLLGEEFALIGRGGAYAFIAKIENLEGLIAVLPPAVEYQGFRAKILQEVFVASNREEIFSEIDAVIQRKTLSLGNTTSFVSQKGLLSGQGKLFLWGKPNRLSFLLPYRLSLGTSDVVFVVTAREGKDLVLYMRSSDADL